jgi:hypothetical protein
MYIVFGVNIVMNTFVGAFVVSSVLFVYPPDLLHLIHSSMKQNSQFNRAATYPSLMTLIYHSLIELPMFQE